MRKFSFPGFLSDDMVFKMEGQQSLYSIDKLLFSEAALTTDKAGACPGFLKGGGPISLGSLKKRSSDFKRGGQMV